MNAWTTLGQWADQGLNPVCITLLEAPAPDGRLAGALAVLEGPEAQAQGPLCSAPFWPADWDSSLKAAAAQNIPEGGRLLTVGGRRYLVSALLRSRSALVLGGGHVGDAVGRLLRFLDFEVELLDDRADFLKTRDDGVRTVEAPFGRLSELFQNSGLKAVVIVTRGHAQDTACLRQVLSWDRQPAYLGMIGSRKRTRETLEMLSREGFPQERLNQVHTPIGLKIGAQTPAEIAVAIAAEVIGVLNG